MWCSTLICIHHDHITTHMVCVSLSRTDILQITEARTQRLTPSHDRRAQCELTDTVAIYHVHCTQVVLVKRHKRLHNGLAAVKHVLHSRYTRKKIVITQRHRIITKRHICDIRLHAIKSRTPEQILTRCCTTRSRSSKVLIVRRCFIENDNIIAFHGSHPNTYSTSLPIHVHALLAGLAHLTLALAALLLAHLARHRGIAASRLVRGI